MRYAALSALLEHLRSSVRDATSATIGWRTFTPQEQRAIIEEIETLVRMATPPLGRSNFNEKDAVHEWLLAQLLAMDSAAAARLAWHILEEREL